MPRNVCHSEQRRGPGRIETGLSARLVWTALQSLSATNRRISLEIRILLDFNERFFGPLTAGVSPADSLSGPSFTCTSSPDEWPQRVDVPHPGVIPTIGIHQTDNMSADRQGGHQVRCCATGQLLSVMAAARFAKCDSGQGGCHAGIVQEDERSDSHR